MAASDLKHTTRTPPGPRDCLSTLELAVRLDEEVNRAGRHHSALSCLLVSLDDVERLSQTHGEQMPAHALAYFAGALERELRRYDRVGHAARGELLVVLPGADEWRGEIVARRALGRLQAVKIEVEGKRQPLRVSVGIATWRDGLTAEQLLSLTRLAAQRRDPEDRRPIRPPVESKAAVDELPTPRRS